MSRKYMNGKWCVRCGKNVPTPYLRKNTKLFPQNGNVDPIDMAVDFGIKCILGENPLPNKKYDILLANYILMFLDEGTRYKVMEEMNVKIDYKVGTMIEVPRACITADEIATEAEFFSFGTNDLTQLTFGFSRDDAGKFLPDYIEKGILEKDPFATIDKKGVGKLVEIAVEKGRKTREDIKIGICGEHGGDPDSVEFCHKIGLDYVSCSPYRIPIAKMAAAQAAIKEKEME